jgi:hypothetical protein
LWNRNTNSPIAVDTFVAPSAGETIGSAIARAGQTVWPKGDLPVLGVAQAQRSTESNAPSANGRTG